MTLPPRPRKRFAQHWLRSEATLDRIVAAAELDRRDRVLEIGPGTGVLTRRLISQAQAVVSVEIDRDLCERLTKSLGQQDNFLLLQGDILSLDLAAHLHQFPQFQTPNKVVANIPYNITGPILEKLLGTIPCPLEAGYSSIVLLVQKEIADRLCAKPGTKAYGALSVRVQYLARCELICDVPAKAFYPPPKVDSAVVRLRPHRLEVPAQNPQYLERLLKLGFAQRRKMLRNNLRVEIERDRLAVLLEQLKINPQARAEDLSLGDWIALSNILASQN